MDQYTQLILSFVLAAYLGEPPPVGVIMVPHGRGFDGVTSYNSADLILVVGRDDDAFNGDGFGRWINRFFRRPTTFRPIGLFRHGSTRFHLEC